MIQLSHLCLPVPADKVEKEIGDPGAADEPIMVGSGCQADLRQLPPDSPDSRAQLNGVGSAVS